MSQSTLNLGIQSINDLAYRLGVERGKLVEIARSVPTAYQSFHFQPRTRPFPKKVKLQAPRRIDRPSPELQYVQALIHKNLLLNLEFPQHVNGGIRRRSAAQHAATHSATTVVTLDVAKFFPSITNKQIYRVWCSYLGCSPKVGALLTKLTTYRRCLPQGAPTSSLLANLVMLMVDGPIREAANAAAVQYSTLVDDLAFSGARAREMIQIAERTLHQEGLRLSRRKLKIMGPTSPKEITGIRLGPSGARASRLKVSRIRAGVHKLAIGLVPQNEQERYINSLIGQLQFLESLRPGEARPGANQLRAAIESLGLPTPLKEAFTIKMAHF